MKHRGPLPRRRALQTRGGRLEYVLSGQGQPTWLLFNGSGVTLDGWRGLYPGIEQLGTVFAWNRFGVGASADPGARQTGTVVLASLRELLSYETVVPPYIVVGHSLGGLYANLFARLYPNEVQAVVLLEATHPDDHEQLHGHEARLAGVLSKLLGAPASSFLANLQAELAWIDETARQVAHAGDFPPVPLVVVNGGNDPPQWLVSPEALALRRARQQELARLSPRGRQLVAEHSGHFPQITQPQQVLDVLREVAAQCAAAERMSAG